MSGRLPEPSRGVNVRLLTPHTSRSHQSRHAVCFRKCRAPCRRPRTPRNGACF